MQVWGFVHWFNWAPECSLSAWKTFRPGKFVPHFFVLRFLWTFSFFVVVVDFVVWILFFLILLRYSVGWHLPFAIPTPRANLNVIADFGSLGLWVHVRCGKPTIALGDDNGGEGWGVWSPVTLSHCTHGPKTAQEVNFKREEFSNHVLIFLSGSFCYACEYNIILSHLWVDKWHCLKAPLCSWDIHCMWLC